MKNFVVTIARGFGSGGRQIAAKLADELHIHSYDNRILKLAAQYSGYPEHYFKEADETLQGNLIEKQLLALPKKFRTSGHLSRFVSDDRLFDFQSTIIKKLAETESCVIVGRCADYILRNYPNVMSVFVHAPHDFCMEQAMLRSSMTEREMEKFIAKTDKYRGEYYHYYTGQEWSSALHYDLCLDSSKLGFDKCVDAILAYRNIRFGED